VGMTRRVFCITSRGVMSDEEFRRDGGEIIVMLPFWIYHHICAALRAMDCPTKPEDYIVAVLEGHLRGRNQ